MARRKQTNPQRTGAEGAADTPSREATSGARSKSPTAPERAKSLPFKEWVEVRPTPLESGCVPIAELSLHSVESDLWEEATRPLPVTDSSAGLSAVSLRVPVLRNTLRHPYDPQEVVCQVYNVTTVQPLTPRNELTSEAGKSENQASGEAGNDLGGVGTRGVFDGPSSGVSALVDLVRGGLATIQAVGPSTPWNGSAQDPTIQEPLANFSPSRQISGSLVLPSTPGTPQNPKSPFDNLTSKSESPGPKSPSQGGTDFQPPQASLPKIRVWLTPAAFADVPTDPSDEQKRPAYGAMQSLFQWVRPDLDHRVALTGFEGIRRPEERSLGTLTPQRGEQMNKGGEEGGVIVDRKGKQKVDEIGGVDLGPDSGGGNELGHHGGFDPKELYAAVRPRR